MKKLIIVLPLLLAAASAPAQVTKNKSGIGFSNYGTYRQIDVAPEQKTKGKGATGTSNVPVYSAKSRKLKLRRISQRDAASLAIQLKGLDGMAMNGVPIQAADVAGNLRIVRYDRHVFGVVDRLLIPMRGSAYSDEDLGRSLSGQVARLTGCTLGGPALMQFKPGHLSKLSVPLAC